MATLLIPDPLFWQDLLPDPQSPLLNGRRGRRRLGLLYLLARHAPINEYQVTELAKPMGLGSKPTVRQDLRELESQGYIKEGRKVPYAGGRKLSKYFDLSHRGFAELMIHLAPSERNYELVSKLLEKYRNFSPELSEVWPEIHSNHLDGLALTGLKMHLLPDALSPLPYTQAKKADNNGQDDVESILAKMGILGSVMDGLMRRDRSWLQSIQRNSMLRTAVVQHIRKRIELTFAAREDLDAELVALNKMLAELEKK